MTRVATVDCGTNSTRLLVAEPTGGPVVGLRTVTRRTQVTRLGQGVDATGRLDAGAVRRTLAVIQGYVSVWRELDARAVRIAATSAVRDAANGTDFLDAVERLTGARPLLLSGDEEARASFRGATAAVEGRHPYCVLDIGGGSTELIVGERTARTGTSRQIGSVRVTERCLTTDPPTGDQLDAATALIDAELDAADAVVDASSARTLVGVAGTVTTLAALHAGLDTPDGRGVHGARIPRSGVRRLTAELSAMTAGERGRLPAVAPGREDVIVAGALILQRVMDRFGFGDVLVSESDILDGLALDLLDGV